LSGPRVLAVLLATATIAHSSCRKSEKPGPSQGVPPASRPLAQPSRELSSAFFVGTAALQTGDFPRAEAELTKATQLAPGEAAAWANLALLEARKAGNAPSTTAESALEKARALAPGEPLVARLRGLYAISRGRTAEAQTALREAGGDPLAKWTLAQSLLASDPTEARKLANELVAAFPQNLALRLGAARFADGDAAAVGAALPPAEALPQQAVEARAAVLSAGDADARRRALQILRNTLLPEREFQRDLAGIEIGTGEIAPPIGRLLAHETPSAQPAVPDRELSLDRRPLPGVTGLADAQVFRPDGTSAPVFVLSDGRKTRLPGGKEIAFATTHVLAVDLDADFLVDLVLGGPTGLTVLKREAAGGFTQIPNPLPIKAVTALVACDLDADGDLDVVAGTAGPTIALLNHGAGRLSVTELLAKTDGLAEAVVVDLDGDADADLELRRSDGRVEIQRNERLLRSERLTRESDPPAVALAVLDADGDGTLDVATLGRDGSLAAITASAALASRVGISRIPLGTLGHGLTGARLFAEDVDHNGAVDLLASGEGAASGRALRLATEKLAYERHDLPLPFTGGVALLDLGRQPARSGLGESARYAVRLTRDYGVKTSRARPDRRRPHARAGSSGVGRAGHSVSAPSPLRRTHRPRQNPRLDVVRVFWPNSLHARPSSATSGRRRQAAPPRSTNASKLLIRFTWNGKAMEFVTDFLWRSPLGLRINAQVTAGCRPNW
jgi:tetratricopeptide (TPR) repeat protein